MYVYAVQAAVETRKAYQLLLSPLLMLLRSWGFDKLWADKVCSNTHQAQVRKSSKQKASWNALYKGKQCESEKHTGEWGEAVDGVDNVAFTSF